MKPLNIFYQEPEPDRWFKFDRYPRKLIRKILRGKQKPGGVMMVALELMRGLDLLKIPYRFNDYAYAKKNPDELIGVIGKPHLIFKKRFKNPILFGAGVYSHPIECPDLFENYINVKKILVPGPWMKEMCEPYYQNKVQHWPVGIDTYKWDVNIKSAQLDIDFLIYDKIRWQHDEYEKTFINPIKEKLKALNLSFEVIRYGSYDHAELIEKLGRCKAMLFLCEHETQGLAYQQVLATGTPILAWDRGGFWQDPYYFPHKVKYKPVSSVPYWDDRCGLKFENLGDFESQVKKFQNLLASFRPREYIIENLTLEKCAKDYNDIYFNLEKEI